MNGAAVGIGARVELMNGKRQAGIVFQTSWTVGLLLTVTPHSRLWPPTLTESAYRISVLSQPMRRPTPSYVPWMNAPRLSVILPPVNRLTCCRAKLLFVPKCGAAPPSCPASVWVKVGACSITAKGGPDQSPPPNV